MDVFFLDHAARSFPNLVTGSFSVAHTFPPTTTIINYHCHLFDQHHHHRVASTAAVGLPGNCPFMGQARLSPSTPTTDTFDATSPLACPPTATSPPLCMHSRLRAFPPVCVHSRPFVAIPARLWPFPSIRAHFHAFAHSV